MAAYAALPHPLVLLDNPPPKDRFKSTLKQSITQYWQDLLALKVRGEDNEMSSLKYFKPRYMSLSRPHPILTTLH